jgi:hypothetical protein
MLIPCDAAAPASMHASALSRVTPPSTGMLTARTARTSFRHARRRSVTLFRRRSGFSALSETPHAGGKPSMT